jgi:porphobilinogen deaminase
MAVIGGGCRFPVAACAQYEGKSVTFRGMAYKPGFKNIAIVKFETAENGLLEKAVQEAKKIILKNENI